MLLNIISHFDALVWEHYHDFSCHTQLLGHGKYLEERLSAAKWNLTNLHLRSFGKIMIFYAHEITIDSPQESTSLSTMSWIHPVILRFLSAVTRIVTIKEKLKIIISLDLFVSPLTAIFNKFAFLKTIPKNAFT